MRGRDPGRTPGGSSSKPRRLGLLVNEFSAEWLALREAADRRARSPALLKATRLWADRFLVPDRPLRILDLGAGTGANLRFLAPRLPRRRSGPWSTAINASYIWHGLPASAAVRCSAWGSARPGDRTRSRATGSLRDLRRDVHLITASALFDLVSEAWCRRLICELARQVRRCSRH